MKREFRYAVIKLKDAQKYLSYDENKQLIALMQKVDRGRMLERKEPINCVCVEKDWPEYEKVWKMIEERVDAEKPVLPS